MSKGAEGGRKKKKKSNEGWIEGEMDGLGSK